MTLMTDRPHFDKHYHARGELSAASHSRGLLAQR